jgi:hypothetical protein
MLSCETARKSTAGACRRWRAASQPEPSGSNPAIPELAAAVAALDPPARLYKFQTNDQ